MSMLYIHIPFCKSRCIYCDFFSSTKLDLRKAYVQALIKQTDSLKQRFSTIYLGGGTPSMLEKEDLRELLQKLSALSENPEPQEPPAQGLSEELEPQKLPVLGLSMPEFTIECNPDDVNPALANLLATSGVNRVSLGVQSFSDARLRQINRRHSAQKAREAVETLRNAGIDNISIDLMYGFPAQTKAEWLSDIKKALKLRPSHISAYCLSVEEGTTLEKQLKDGTLPPLPDEDTQEDLYYTLINILKANGYEHYEISNFCLPGRHSRHNSGYWQDKSYVALGAGAHGYDRQNAQRYWNIRDIQRYIGLVAEGKSVVEGSEQIDPATHYNDLITTAMRTARGLSADYVAEACSPQLAEHFLSAARRLQAKGLLNIQGRTATLPPDKLFISDAILSELIF